MILLMYYYMHYVQCSSDPAVVPLIVLISNDVTKFQDCK